ncbi:MAG: hypothetical protein QM820_14935 [Minicystis sp.]
MIPASFQKRRVLQLLNVVAVGCALAAIASALLAMVFDSRWPIALITALPTWLVGTAWAALLRWRKTVGRSTLRLGWVASLPLAMLNASLAGGFLAASQTYHSYLSEFLIGAVAGPLVGVIIWLPALIATLVCFGVPIARAQRLAEKGLAGEERGEWMVGLTCVVMSSLGLLLSYQIPLRSYVRHHAWHELGRIVTPSLALLGLLTGGAAAALALARETRRRRFVEDAESGKIAGYRVDPTEEGKVLVRVVSQGKGYRVADFEEEVYALDAEGEATQPKQMEMSK